MKPSDIKSFANSNIQKINDIVTKCKYKPTDIIDQVSSLFIEWYNDEYSCNINKNTEWGWFNLNNTLFKFFIVKNKQKIFSFKVPNQLRLSSEKFEFKEIVLILEDDGKSIKHASILNSHLVELDTMNYLFEMAKNWNGGKVGWNSFKNTSEELYSLFNNNIKKKLFNSNNISKSHVFHKHFYGNKNSFNLELFNTIKDNEGCEDAIFEAVSNIDIYNFLKTKYDLDYCVNTNFPNILSKPSLAYDSKKFILDIIVPVVKGYYGECVVNLFLKSTKFKKDVIWCNKDDYFKPKLEGDYSDFIINTNDYEVRINSKFSKNVKPGEVFFMGEENKKDNISYIYTNWAEQ